MKDNFENIYYRSERLISNRINHNTTFFKQNGVTIKTQSHPATDIIIKKYLQYAETNSINKPNWAIRSLVDKSLYYWLCDDFSNEWRACLDYGDVGIIYGNENIRVIIYKNTKGIISINYQDKSINIISYQHGYAFVDLYKTIRQVFTSILMKENCFPYQASCVKVGDQVIAFCGNKGVGKTTALVHSLNSNIKNLEFISNDRILINYDDLSVWFLPTIMSIDGELLASIDNIESKLKQDIYLKGKGVGCNLLDYELFNENVFKGQRNDNYKIRLTPLELKVLFPNVKHTDGSRLTKIAHVNFIRDSKENILSKIDCSQKKIDVLKENIQTSIKSYTNWLGLLEDDFQIDTDFIVKKMQTKLNKIDFFKISSGKKYKDIIKGFCANSENLKLGLSSYPSFHFGVYGVAISKDKILVVLKSRGPYTGFYDLPGGSVEFGENYEEALKREIVEETGSKITKWDIDWFDFDLNVEFNFRNEEIQFRHIGKYKLIDIDKKIKSKIDNEDVESCEWKGIEEIKKMKKLSSPLIYILNKHFNE